MKFGKGDYYLKDKINYIWIIKSEIVSFFVLDNSF